MDQSLEKPKLLLNGLDLSYILVNHQVHYHVDRSTLCICCGTFGGREYHVQESLFLL